MRLLCLLLTAWVSCCIIYGLHAESLEEQYPEASDDATSFLMSSLFGFRPCLDESCTDTSVQRDKYPVNEGFAPENLPRQNDEPQNAYMLFPSIDPTVDHCLPLRVKTLNEIEAIENRHPGIKDIKLKVIESFLRYVSLFSLLDSENCDPVMKLLDFMHSAAETLAEDYAKLHGKCVYTYNDEDSKSKGYPRPGKDITNRASTSKDPTDMSSASVYYCLPLRASTLHEVEVIENRHPGIKDIKLKVIESFLRYVSLFSLLDSENCDPAMKLLDFMHSAAETLAEDYAKLHGKCVYTYNDEDSKSEGYPDHGKDDTNRTSTSKNAADLPTTSPDYVSTESSTSAVPCPEKPSPEIKPTDESIREDDYESPPYVGSVRGIPGVHYPNYSEVPITSFSCADKKYIPGFYADLETGCQVFHVCYEHRRESFLCPVGTVFNQPILACDYWYSSNCSLAPVYYEVNAKTEEATKGEETDVAVEELINVLIESKKESVVEINREEQLSHVKVNIEQFLPVKAKVTEYMIPEIEEQKAVFTAKPEVIEVEEIASQIFNKMVSSATNVVSKGRDIVEKASAPELGKPVEMKLSKAKLAAAAIPLAKVAAVKTALPIITAKKLAAAAIPVAKVVAAKTVLPVAGTAKLAAAAVPVAKVVAAKTVLPIAVKTKLVAAVPAKKGVAKAAIPVVAKAKLVAAVPKVAAKASIPMLKTKMIASAVPLAKSKMVAPVFKGKALKAASIPLAKAKVMALPLVKSKLAGPAPIMKAKLAKAAAISPLTKKALALGYMKLLKAKKLALMG